VTIITGVLLESGLDREQGGWDRPSDKQGSSMTIQVHAENHLGRDSSIYDLNLSRARTAGYVLLTGLSLEIVASLIWFKGIESLASLMAIALVASGVAGEIFFEYRARRADKDIVSAPPVNEVQEPELGGDAVPPSCFVARPNDYKLLSQLPNRERRKLLGRRERDRAALSAQRSTG
jgi:hypothetical protein